MIGEIVVKLFNRLLVIALLIVSALVLIAAAPAQDVELPEISIGAFAVAGLIFTLVSLVKALFNVVGVTTAPGLWGHVAKGLAAVAIVASIFVERLDLVPQVEAGLYQFQDWLDMAVQVAVIFVGPGVIYGLSSEQSIVPNGNHAED